MQYILAQGFQSLLELPYFSSLLKLGLDTDLKLSGTGLGPEVCDRPPGDVTSRLQLSALNLAALCAPAFFSCLLTIDVSILLESLPGHMTCIAYVLFMYDKASRKSCAAKKYSI